MKPAQDHTTWTVPAPQPPGTRVIAGGGVNDAGGLPLAGSPALAGSTRSSPGGRQSVTTGLRMGAGDVVGAPKASCQLTGLGGGTGDGEVRVLVSVMVGSGAVTDCAVQLCGVEDNCAALTVAQLAMGSPLTIGTPVRSTALAGTRRVKVAVGANPTGTEPV